MTDGTFRDRALSPEFSDSSASEDYKRIDKLKPRYSSASKDKRIDKLESRELSASKDYKRIDKLTDHPTGEVVGPVEMQAPTASRQNVQVPSASDAKDLRLLCEGIAELLKTACRCTCVSTEYLSLLFKMLQEVLEKLSLCSV